MIEEPEIEGETVFFNFAATNHRTTDIELTITHIAIDISSVYKKGTSQQRIIYKNRKKRIDLGSIKFPDNFRGKVPLLRRKDGGVDVPQNSSVLFYFTYKEIDILKAQEEMNSEANSEGVLGIPSGIKYTLILKYLFEDNVIELEKDINLSPLSFGRD